MSFLMRLCGITFSDAERDPAVEAAYIKEIPEVMLKIQANAAVKQHRALLRTTHAKGTSARAQFEVVDVTVGRARALAQRLAKGIFATPGVYPATVRFANAFWLARPDFTPDIRSLSFSVDLTCGGICPPVAGTERQDFSLQNCTTLNLNDIRVFLPTMKLFAAPNLMKGLASISLRDVPGVVRTIAIGEMQSRQPVRPYQVLRYWSNVPFRHGLDDVVQYSAIPSPVNTWRPLRRSDPDALQTELVRHLNEDAAMSSFDFGIQLLNSDKMTYLGKRRDAKFWIENASIEWPEKQAPFHTVARLTLLPKSQLSQAESDATYIDVTTNASPESAPVGSINRARWGGEYAGRKARMATKKA